MAKRAKKETLLECCVECIAEFPSRIILIEHLIRVHKQSMDILPIDVLENILDHLHPNDLVGLSQTCHKYKHLIAVHFERKRHCGWIRIFSAMGRPQFHIYRNEKYEIYFRRMIRNIVVSMHSGDAVAKIFQFVRENCSKNIWSLILDGLGPKIQINENHLQIIGDQVKQLDALVIENGIVCNMGWDRFANIRILCDRSSDMRMLWATKVFPNLRTLCLMNDSRQGWHPHNLDIFIRNHMQMKTFCSDNLSTIRCVLSTSIKLSNAIFNDMHKGCLGKLLTEMEKSHNQIESFDLQFENMKERKFYKIVAGMKKVKKLHCDVGQGDIRIFNGMNIQLPHIQVLCLKFSVATTCAELKMIGKSFPNLSELWIQFALQTDRTFNEVVTILVDGLAKLKHLYLDGTWNFGEKSDFNLENWKPVRNQLENTAAAEAAAVTVHIGRDAKFNYYEFPEFKANRVVIETDNDTFCRMCSQNTTYVLEYFTSLRNYNAKIEN